jgi:imidazolonepropionase-like amidohydrolase
VIAAYTFNASSALALQNRMGSLEVGKYANFISINTEWSELFYHIGQTQVDRIFTRGYEFKNAN